MELLKNIVQCIDDAKVKHIKIYETKSITPFFDYVIVGTANSSRQLRTVVEHIKKDSDDKRYSIRGIEGVQGGYWVLVDIGDVLVNVFLQDEREKYDLDKLWKDLPQIDSNKLL